MGSPFSGLNLTFWSRVRELLQLGSWERFSGPSLGWVFVILWSTGRLWSGVGSTFSCLHFWQGLCGYPSSQRRNGSWPCCLSPSPGGSVCFGGLFYTWCLSGDSPVLLGSPWRLPPRLVSLGGSLLGPPAVSSWLHEVGVVRRAIPFPGPLWRRLQIFCFGSTARKGFAFPPLGAIAWWCLRCFISASLSYRFTLSFGPSSAPFGCLPLAGLFALLLGPLLCFFVIYLPRLSHHSVHLLSARLSR